MGLSDAWVETALGALTLIDGSDEEFATITDTIDINQGEKGFDVIANIAGGRIIKFNPEEPTEVTLEAYPLEAGTDTGTTLKGFFHMLHTTDASQPLSIDVSRTRTKVRLMLLWTDDTAVTTAGGATSANKKAFRFVFQNGYVISAKPAFTDGILKFTVVCKFPPFDKSGTANITWKSTDGTATMAAESAYTS